MRIYGRCHCIDDINIWLLVRLVNMEIYVLYRMAHAPSRPGPPQACKSLLVDASTLGTIHRAVLMLFINSSKVIELRDWITPDCLPAFLPIRRTYLAVLILRQHRVSVIHPKNIMVGHSR